MFQRIRQLMRYVFEDIRDDFADMRRGDLSASDAREAERAQEHGDGSEQ